MQGEQINAGHRRAIQLALFACVLAAGFVLLLSHAGRADAVGLTTPLLPGATVDVPIVVPAVATDFAVPPVAHVTSSPPPVSPTIATIKLALTLPPAVSEAVETVTKLNVTNPNPPPADPPATTSAPLTTRPVVATQAGPVRVERNSSNAAPTALPADPFSPTPAPRPAPPAVPTTSSLARADGGSTQLAATLAVAIALVILFPVGIARARRLVLPTLSFRPLARPG